LQDVEKFWPDTQRTKRVKKLEVSDGERWRAAQVKARRSRARFQIRSTAFAAPISPADRLDCPRAVEYGINGIRKMDAGRQRCLRSRQLQRSKPRQMSMTVKLPGFFGAQRTKLDPSQESRGKGVIEPAR